ncbi:MAG: hypothetical protein GF398_07295 [Chitinivibrionales bacterium]|nr:hypothetical protein [Chitinivibrionales bacterium]
MIKKLTVTKKIESDTLQIPELTDLIGKDVEITIAYNDCSGHRLPMPHQDRSNYPQQICALYFDTEIIERMQAQGIM